MALLLLVSGLKLGEEPGGKAMPIFEYQCQRCGHVFEKVRLTRQGSASPPCPSCHMDESRQIVSRFSSPSTSGGEMICAPSAIS
jgi:putative FmdB family regulatory protein